MTVETLREEAKDLHDETVRLRRQLHERPEIGNELPVTREIVLEAIDGLPLDVQLHETSSGIAALLDRRQAGPDRAPARRHGRPAAARGHRSRLQLAQRRNDARVRARHPRGDARRCGPAAVGTARRDPRSGAVHVPAWRGGPSRRPLHARRRAARRAAARRRHTLARHRSVRAAHHVDRCRPVG